MPLDRAIFQEQFSHFKRRVGSQQRPQFTSFREGFTAEWEGYKEPLRERAIARLNLPSNSLAEVGQGEILERLIDSIEMSAAQGVAANNLVRWENRYGHAARSHRALLEARDDPAAVRRIEAWAVEFFGGVIPDAEAFDRFREIVGSKYDLLAYMFFLKDWDRYMPIAPETADRAFAALGVDLITRRKCSWNNYQQYNDTLQDVRAELTVASGLPNVRLIDAHSFCWLLVRPEVDRPDPPTKRMSEPKPVAMTDELWTESIRRMANVTLNTARNANGQQVMVTRKAKELRMGMSELSAYIAMLLAKQKGKCALTGILLPGENGDPQLLPSLDRIDSNGHYEKRNLQVVCKFINAWKNDTADSEFTRLLALVRNEESVEGG
jgi:hypothetical protein